MPLTPQQTQQLQHWMQQKHVHPQCGACGAQNQWTFGQITNLLEYQPGFAMSVGGPAVPVVELICTNCAHVSFFAAKPIGLV